MLLSTLLTMSRLKALVIERRGRSTLLFSNDGLAIFKSLRYSVE